MTSARLRGLCLLLSGLLLAGLLAPAATAQTPKPAANPGEGGSDYIRENYTKYEHKIPMRDGVKLLTAVYAPKDESTTYPILMMRTPYSIRPYGEDGYPMGGATAFPYAKEKFIYALQDVRGRYGSEGTFVHVRPQRPDDAPAGAIDESTDAWDTIDWLVKNVANNNGKVGMSGISYPGFYAAAGMIDSHPALKCVSPQAPIADWFVGDDFHHNGTFYLPHAFRFLATFGQKLEEPIRQSPRPFDFKTPDGYAFYLKMGPLANADKEYFKGNIEFWDDLMSHGTYDAFWQARNLRPHLKNIKAAVMTVGGWYDAEDLFGALNTFKAVEKNNPGISNMLVMGPWAHGGWARGDGDHLGNVSFHGKASEFYRDQIELPFLKHFLKGDGKFEQPKAFVFEGGTDQWRKYDAWPPRSAVEKSLYLHAGGKLSFDPPAEAENAFDEYISDPAKPVPYIANIAIGMTREHMTDDQRFASSRPDVISYQSELLEEDITLAGPIAANLHVSTTGTDSDFVVKLIDVYSGDYPNPDPNPAGVEMGGYQQLVRGEAMRGKFRNGFDKPQPFEPGKTAAVNYVLPDISHTFRRGHRIMVQVQSSWFPLVDRNPQRFCDIYHAKAEDFQKATQRVYHSGTEASLIRVEVVPQGRGAGVGKP